MVLNRIFFLTIPRILFHFIGFKLLFRVAIGSQTREGVDWFENYYIGEVKLLNSLSQLTFYRVNYKFGPCNLTLITMEVPEP